MTEREHILTFADLNPPLIIDFGSDSFKYSRPIINTSIIAKKLTQSSNKNDDLKKLNCDTIFDFNFSKKIKLNYSPDDPEFDYIDTFGDIEAANKYNKYNFEEEPIYQGIINNKENYKNFIKKFISDYLKEKEIKEIGEDFFKNTPIIILQDCYPLEKIYKQISDIYTFFFTEIESPYVLIQSKASLDLFSHNLNSGIVVDLGESKTSITPVINGFADYSNTLINTFLSGRNVTNFVHKCMTEMEGINKSYIEVKNDKEKDLCCNHFGDKFKEFEKEHKYCFCNYLYFFPELFKSVFRKDDWNLTFKDLIDRIKSSKDEPNDNNYKNSFENFYGNSTNETLFKISDYPSEFIKKHLQHNREYSLPHLIGLMVNKLSQENPTVFDKKNFNVVLSGGVLNSPGMIDNIKKEMKYLNEDNASNLKFFYNEQTEDKPYVDHSLTFFKGSNYMSNLENLQYLMISKKDFDEQGSDNLGYNFI